MPVTYKEPTFRSDPKICNIRYPEWIMLIVPYVFVIIGCLIQNKYTDISKMNLWLFPACTAGGKQKLKVI